MRDDVLVAFEHLKVGQELVPPLDFAALVDDELVRKKVRTPLVGRGEIWVLDGVKHVKENLLLVGREARRRLVEDAAVYLRHVVVALVHLELQERPAYVADAPVGRVEPAGGEKVGDAPNVLDVNVGLLLVLDLLHVGAKVRLAHILGKGRVFLLLAILRERHARRLTQWAYLNGEVGGLLHGNVANVAGVVAGQVAARRGRGLGPALGVELDLELVDDLLRVDRLACVTWRHLGS